MKYRPSKRVIWLLIPLAPLLLMSVTLWVDDDSEASRIATRGSRPPEQRLLAKPFDWYDEGFSALMTSNLNPWRNEWSGSSFGSRIDALANSDRPEDQEKYKQLMRQAKEWYDRLLARYPELAVTYKSLPAEKNGLLQWYRFQKRITDAARKSGKPSELECPFSDHFRNPRIQPWDPVAAKAWLDQRSALLEEARAIALMPDQSSGGITSEGLNRYPSLTLDCANAFLLEARWYAEQGDAARALESVRAATGLARLLTGGEAPTLSEGLRGSYIHQEIESYVFSGILPALPGGAVDISLWENVVSPRIQQPDDFSRMVRGQWNHGMPMEFLPNLADPSDPSAPTDAEALAEAYTQFSRSLATKNGRLALTDLPSNPSIRPSYSDLTRRSQIIAEDYGMTQDSYNIRDSWERKQVQGGMTRAAFAILKGEPIPSDPVHSLPYRWDPATRKLSLPDIPEYKKLKVKPMVVPQL
jgi:hypothetical protein